MQTRKSLRLPAYDYSQDGDPYEREIAGFYFDLETLYQ